MGFREPAYAVVLAALGFVALILALLAVFFVCDNPRRTKPSYTHVAARFNAILICFVVAIVFGVLAAVCGRLTYKCMKAASRKNCCGLFLMIQKRTNSFRFTGSRHSRF